MLTYEKSERMTNTQMSVMQAVNIQLQAEIDNCIHHIEGANNAVVGLPYTNEKGLAVIHGCNLCMHSIAQYWVSRLNALEVLLGRDFRNYTGGRSMSDISDGARKKVTR